MSAELCSGEPLLRVGRKRQQTAACKASAQTKPKLKVPTETNGCKPWTLEHVDCQPQRAQNKRH